MKKQKSVFLIAQHDISKYINPTGTIDMDENGDIWVVNANRLFNKESKRLNRELGVHKVNKGKDK